MFLTTDGEETGRPCLVEVPEAADLLEPDQGLTTVASDGTPFTESPLIDGKGIPFQLIIKNCSVGVYEDLIDFLNFNQSQGTDFNVTGTGTPGSFDVQAIKNYPRPVSWSGFNTDLIKGLTIRLITTAVNGG